MDAITPMRTVIPIITPKTRSSFCCPLRGLGSSTGIRPVSHSVAVLDAAVPAREGTEHDLEEHQRRLEGERGVPAADVGTVLRADARRAAAGIYGRPEPIIAVRCPTR
jgi:hypothetical protein